MLVEFLEGKERPLNLEVSRENYCWFDTANLNTIDITKTLEEVFFFFDYFLD